MREVSIAEMRHRVAWQRPASGPRDAMNQRRDQWETVGEYWAKVEPLSGFELSNAKQIKAEVSTKITMRNVGDVRPTHRFILILESSTFNIVSVFRLDPQNRFLVIHGFETPNQGS